MGYIQGETINLTANSGGLLLFSSATDSSYDSAPDARIANINAKVTISNVTISSGGSLYNKVANATVSGVTVYSRGYIGGGSRAYFSNVVVSSGGTFVRPATGPHMVNLSAYSGAIISAWNGGATYFGGAENYVVVALIQAHPLALYVPRPLRRLTLVFLIA